MTIPTIAALPTAPQRTDAPATFVTRADAFVAALPTLRTQINTTTTAIDGVAVAVSSSAAEAAASSTSAAAAATAALMSTVVAAVAAFISVLNVGRAATKASALVTNVAGASVLCGAVGSAAIVGIVILR